jgi:hypothetical protein
VLFGHEFLTPQEFEGAPYDNSDQYPKERRPNDLWLGLVGYSLGAGLVAGNKVPNDPSRDNAKYQK